MNKRRCDQLVNIYRFREATLLKLFPQQNSHHSLSKQINHITLTGIYTDVNISFKVIDIRVDASSPTTHHRYF